MSKKDFKSSKAILDDLYEELKSQNGHSDDPDKTGGSSSSDEEEEEDEDERRSRKRKDKKKHKKSKKKKKKHRRSHSRDDNSDEYDNNRKYNDDDDRKKKKKDKSERSRSSSRHENTKRVLRPLSPPVPVRRLDDYPPPPPQHDDYWHQDDIREVQRRVPPPPPPEEWVKKDSGLNSPLRYDNRSSHRDELHHGRDREERGYDGHRDGRDRDDHGRREEREVRRSYSYDKKEKRHRDERSPSRDKERRHRDERSPSRDKEKRHSNRSRESERQPKRSKEDDDAFWDSKWEASEIQKKADEKERKGRHFLAPEKRRPRTPSPDHDRDSSPETSEALTIKRLKDIENLVVKDSEKYVAEPMNPDMFEWDEKTKMRRKKFVPIPKAESEEEEPEERINTRELTLDEIEEIRRKREKNKKDRKKEKEEGELGSDEDRRSKSHRKRSRSPFTDRRHGGGGFYDRRRSPPRRGGGFGDFRRQRSRSRDRYDDRRSSRRRNSRSRSRERKRDDGFRGSRSAIDKAKLLAIAQKNAVKLLNSNDLKGMDKGRLVAIKSGGQSLGELTLFCRELARKGITDEFSDDDNGGNSDDESNLNHPFAVRDRAIPNPIMLSVTGLKSITSTAPKNALTLASMTPAMRDAARSHRLNEFPVSSGNAHRVKEADITEEEHIKKIPTGIIAAQNAVTSLANTNDPIFKMLKIDPTIEMVKLPPLPTQLIQRKIPEVKPEPEEDSKEEEEAKLTEAQKLNLANPLGVIMFGGHLDPPMTFNAPDPAPKIEESVPMVPAPPSPPSVFKVPAIPSMPTFAPDMSMGMNGPSSQAEPVFEPLAQPSKDISSIISIRLNAMKRLSSNPDDPVALKELYDAQQEMSTWAASKNKPGQFTGHTGAKVLSKGELMTGIQAWARSEQFTKAQKVSGGFGEYMLRKMGWREGDGLGKDRSGEVDPLQLDIKMDKKGLISAEEMVGKRGKGGNDALTMTGLKDMTGKHPVTAIMEVATRRKWGPPNFTQIFECGPPHKKQYIWKCTVNGIDYQPTIASDNKKKAKSNAATVALQELGMVAKDPNNPL